MTLKAQAEPSRNKHARIRSPQEIWKACEAFMLEIARSDSALTHPSASRYRDAMILGVLAHRPLRRRNIASLALGAHLTQEAGKWYCYIPHTETKDRRSIEFALPQDEGFAACFSYYLQVCDRSYSNTTPLDQDAVAYSHRTPVGFNAGARSNRSCALLRCNSHFKGTPRGTTLSTSVAGLCRFGHVEQRARIYPCSQSHPWPQLTQHNAKPLRAILDVGRWRTTR